MAVPQQVRHGVYVFIKTGFELCSVCQDHRYSGPSRHLPGPAPAPWGAGALLSTIGRPRRADWVRLEDSLPRPGPSRSRSLR